MRVARSEGAWLAGVCSRLARALGWNVWAIRALFVVFLLVKTLWAVVAYAGLALTLHVLDRHERDGSGEPGGLSSPELSARNQRISDLERRFRDLEEKG
jgi:phage shock protein PspC (stress-responsive transcriptional regulator)